MFEDIRRKTRDSQPDKASHLLAHVLCPTVFKYACFTYFCKVHVFPKCLSIEGLATRVGLPLYTPVWRTPVGPITIPIVV